MTRANFTLDVETQTTLSKLSRLTGRPRSQIVREAVAAYWQAEGARLQKDAYNELVSLGNAKSRRRAPR